MRIHTLDIIPLILLSSRPIFFKWNMEGKEERDVI